ncbi:nucleotid_trans domain-containing protein [Pycnococcus provasolii]
MLVMASRSRASSSFISKMASRVSSLRAERRSLLCVLCVLLCNHANLVYAGRHKVTHVRAPALASEDFLKTEIKATDPAAAAPTAPARSTGAAPVPAGGDAAVSPADRGMAGDDGLDSAPQVSKFRSGAQLHLGEDITTASFGDILESHVATPQKEFIYTIVEMPDNFRQGSVILEWLRNFMYNFQRVGRAHNILLVGINDKTCELIRTADIPCYVDKMSDEAYGPVLEAVGPKPIGGKHAILKWIYASMAVKSGFHGLYLHYNAAAIRDPFRRWDRTFDFQGLSDVQANAGQRDWFSLQRECKTYAAGQEVAFVAPVKVCMSTELFFFRASQATQALIDGMLFSITKKPGEWEQMLFQWAVIAYTFGEGGSPVLRFRLLDVDEYANIPVYRNRDKVRANGEDNSVILVPGQMVEGMKRDAVATVGRWSPQRWNYEEAGKQRSMSILTSNHTFESEDERSQAFLDALKDPERQRVREARARASYNWQRASYVPANGTDTTTYVPGSNPTNIPVVKWRQKRGH